MILSRPGQATQQTIIRTAVALAMVIVIGSAGWAARLTRAEFEVPLVDTTDFVPSEFRSVLGYYRGTRWDGTSEVPGTTTVEHYEGYALGQPIDNVNGYSTMYYFDGVTWKKMLPQGGSVVDANYRLNSVGTQYNYDTGYGPIWVVGYQGAASRQAFILNFENYPVTPGNYDPEPAKLGASLLQNYDNPASGFRALINGLSPGPNNTELYAVAAAKTYLGWKLAGGMNGTLATPARRNTCDNTTDEMTDCPSGKHENWTTFTFSAANAPGISDNITGIIYSTLDTAYVSTSTFPTGKRPYDRECTGAQTGRIFRVTGNPALLSSWTKVAEVSNECFYGLSVVAQDVQTIENGPLKTSIWIASSKGVRQVDDENSGSVVTGTLVKNTTSGTPTGQVYGVAAVPLRSGLGQQLLVNGDFKAWSAKVPVNGTELDYSPTNWLDNPTSPYTFVPGSTPPCASGSRDTLVTDTGGRNFALKVRPGLGYGNASCSILDSNGPTRMSGLFQRLDLTNIEGTRFKVSGRYKVTYIDNASLPSPATTRQGGVATACSGNYPPNGGTGLVDCPFSNLREIRTLTSAVDNTVNVPGNVGGFISFSYEFSRAQKQFTFIPGAKGYPYPSQNNLSLEIRCLATYGVEVICDDLKIEAVDEPARSRRSTVLVTAVGQNSLTLINRDAIAEPTTWAIDDKNLLNLTTPIQLNAVTSAGSQHIFAVGSGTSLLQRSPGNLSGFVWLGASQNTPSARSALGWLAISCANLKDNKLSLCQRHPESFALTLEDNVLSGRAWFGKQMSGTQSSDYEARDLGACLRPLGRKAGLPATTPYAMTGSCGTNSADPATFRRCVGDTSKACLRDFDCFGRCSGDEGYICLSDRDCVGADLNASSPSTPVITGSNLAGIPPKNLLCGNIGSSPNACNAAGWLTFNASDLPGNNVLGPDTIGGSFDPATGRLSGLGRFTTLASATDPNYQVDQGWVKLRGVASVAQGSYIYGARSCTTSVTKKCSSNMAVDCTDNPALCVGAGNYCITASTCQFGQDRVLQSCQPGVATCRNFCEGDPTRPCATDVECTSLYGPTAGACEPIGYCAQSLSSPNGFPNGSRCKNDSQCAGVSNFCILGSICNALPVLPYCNVYGVDHDETTGKFQGFAWSSDYGWLDFRSTQKGTSRFIQTRLGDIYSGADIGSPSTIQPSSCNATYLISAVGTINNFCTGLDTGLANFGARQQGVGAIPISSGRNDYTNALGRFDLTGIETDVGSKKNKYGQDIITITPQNMTNSLTYSGSPLDGTSLITLNRKVYIADCGVASPCIFNQALKIQNAAAGSNGAGILVVNGSLTIKNNLQYVNSSIDDLRRLASLVVVVRGDLTIDNQVTNIMGSYYVEGTVFTTPTAAATSSDNRYPLTIRGLMIAKNFEFNRKFAGTVESPLPSELFIFDGRLQSNPLPGMVDFASALPNSVSSSP